MNRLKLWMLAAALAALCLLAAGCDNDDFGLFFAHFGVANSDSCRSLTVEIDLTAADALPAVDLGGDLRCTLAAERALEDCDFSVRVERSLRGNDVLLAQIDQCSLPAVAALFDCGFTEIEFDTLAENTTATCNCTARGHGCNPRPDLCVAQSSGCQTGLPTTTHPPINSTSTTSTSSTTTSTVPLRSLFSYRSTFEIPDEERVGAVQFDVDYSELGGPSRGTDNDLRFDCATLIDGALAEFSNDRTNGVLTVGLVSLAGFDTPAEIVECQLAAPSELSADGLQLEVVEAVDPETNPIDVSVGVGTFDLESRPTTTTSTSSTSTTTTTTDTSSCSTSTTLPEDATDYVVTFRVDGSVPLIGGIQWDVDYRGTGGAFRVGATARDADCTIAPNIVGLAAFGLARCPQVVTGGVIALDGFLAPAPVASCRFASSDGRPDVDDFRIEVTHAAFADLQPIEPKPGMSATVRAAGASSTTSTTTSTTLDGSALGTMWIDLELTDEFDEIGFVRFTVDHTAANGSFVRAPNGVSPRCLLSPNIDGIGLFTDPPSGTVLGGAIESAQRFESPATLASCLFRPDDEALSAEQFSANVTFIGGPNIGEVDPLPTLAVSIRVPLAISGRSPRRPHVAER